MQVGVKTIGRSTSIYEAVRILVERNITGLPVVDRTNLAGIITEKDILNVVFRNESQPGPVENYMTTPVTSFREADSLTDISICLTRNAFRRAPVLRGDQLIGLISRADLIRTYMTMLGVSSTSPKRSTDSTSATARTVMTSGLLTTHPQASIVEAMGILVAHGITGLPVVDDAMNLVGIISEKDLLVLLHDPYSRSCRVGDVMSRDLTTFGPDTDLLEVCECLARSSFRRVPIIERQKLVGIISRSDMLLFILKRSSTIGLSSRAGAEDPERATNRTCAPPYGR